MISTSESTNADPAVASTETNMSNDGLLQLTKMPLEQLRACARVSFRTLPTHEELMEDFAQAIVAEIRTHNEKREPTRLILPVGPVSQYRRVVELSNRERISWKNVHAFNMDEFLDWQGRPIPTSHPLSFEGFMRREVFERLDPELRMPGSQAVFPHPFRIDEISERIRSVGGIDCCFGGIGFHGHIAFNEPPLSRWHRITVAELRDSLTRVLVLGDDSVVVQSIHCSGGNTSAIPPMCVTLGMKDILASRKIRLYCCAGERHRTIFRITVAGQVTVDFPSTLIQGHPDAQVVTDSATAAPVRIKLG